MGSTYINVSIEDDQKHVDKEVPGEGDQDWVVVDWQGPVLCILTYSEDTKSSEILSLGFEESHDYIEEYDIHRHGYNDVLDASVKEP